jgi:hypothetical protein
MNREQRAQKIIQKPGYPDIYAQPPQTISDILRDIQTVMPSKLDNQYHRVSKHIQSIYIICPAKKIFIPLRSIKILCSLRSLNRMTSDLRSQPAAWPNGQAYGLTD